MKLVNIMLKLKNIKLNNNTLSAEYHPENSDDFGIVSIDTRTKEVTKQVLAKHDETFPIYLNHAVDVMKKLCGMTEIPHEKLVMWH